MSVNYDRKVVLSPKGTNRREVALKDIHIPDLWHVYLALKDDPYFSDKVLGVYEDGSPKSVADAVLECWHLTKDLYANLAGDVEDFLTSKEREALKRKSA